MLPTSYHRVSLSFLLMVTLFGCAESKYLSRYEGNIEEVATIKGNDSFNPTYWGMRETGIIRINGSKFMKYASDGFVLTPGAVSVVVGIEWGDPLDAGEDILAILVGYRGKQRVGNKFFEFNAEKNHEYIAKAYNYEGGWQGKGGAEYVWIEDNRTGGLVAGEKPPDINKQ